MEARMAQAKANRTLPFFFGATASGSAAEAISGGAEEEEARSGPCTVVAVESSPSVWQRSQWKSAAFIDGARRGGSRVGSPPSPPTTIRMACGPILTASGKVGPGMTCPRPLHSRRELDVVADIWAQ